MRYCLDSLTIIAALRGRVPGVEARLRGLEPGQVWISEVVRAELLFGAVKSGRPERNRRLVEAFIAPMEWVAFGGEAVEHYCLIRTQLEQEGRMIGGNDLLIAATARATGAVVVTGHRREFERVPGLVVEDWTVG